MNEVEKMYKNCGIKKQYCGWLDMGDLDTQYEYVRCGSLKEWEETALMSRTKEKDLDKPSIEYPPFTAEKQIAIIKWLSDVANCIDICYDKYKGLFGMQIGLKYSGIGYNDDFAELLASRVNNIWNDLYPKNKEQIREILK